MADAVLDALADGILAFDRGGRISLINPAARTLLGLVDETEVLGMSAQQLASRVSGRFANPAQFRAALRPGSRPAGQGLELDLDEPHGRLRILDLDAANAGVTVSRIVLLRDTTPQKRQEHAQAERLRVAAHDLKTPLTSVKAYAQFAVLRIKRLVASGPLNEAQDTLIEQALQYLQTVNEQADKLTELIAALLERQGTESGRQEAGGRKRETGEV